MTKQFYGRKENREITMQYVDVADRYDGECYQAGKTIADFVTSTKQDFNFIAAILLRDEVEVEKLLGNPTLNVNAVEPRVESRSPLTYFNLTSLDVARKILNHPGFQLSHDWYSLGQCLQKMCLNHDTMQANVALIREFYNHGMDVETLTKNIDNSIKIQYTEFNDETGRGKTEYKKYSDFTKNTVQRLPKDKTALLELEKTQGKTLEQMIADDSLPTQGSWCARVTQTSSSFCAIQ